MSISFQCGCSFIRCPPHALQNLRWLRGVLANVPTCSCPRVMRTASGAHSVNALTGPADHVRQSPQWQYPIAFGSPSTTNATFPQKQRPSYCAIGRPPRRESTGAPVRCRCARQRLLDVGGGHGDDVAVPAVDRRRQLGVLPPLARSAFLPRLLRGVAVLDAGGLGTHSKELELAAPA